MTDTRRPLILIADDDVQVLKLIGRRIQELSYRGVGVTDKTQLLDVLAQERPSLLLLDLHFGFSNGIELIGEIVAKHPGLVIVLLTGKGTISDAVTAIKQGAYDFLTKPPDWPRLEMIIRHAIERDKLHAHISALERSADGERPLLGDDPSMQKVRDLIQTVAPTDAPVLLLGESGTGKELAARAIHAGSGRRNEAFVAVNMACLPHTLVESTLFGHEKGAFTGADKQRIGCFEAAERGTLFLDEIGEMDLALQAKLLRFLQERTFERVGSSKSIAVDCRIVAATNRDLPEMVRRGEFREDLYYRLNVVPVQLPPLRQRRIDIPMLAARFLRRTALRYRKELTGFTPAALTALSNHDWPGNVRELENLVERMVILTPGGPVIGVEAIPPEVRGTTPASLVASAPPDKSLDRFEQIERQAIVEALDKSNGHIRIAAEYLGIGQATMYRKLKRYDISQREHHRAKAEAAR